MRRAACLLTLCIPGVAAVCAQPQQVELPSPVPETNRAWRIGLTGLGTRPETEGGCIDGGASLRTRGGELDAQQAVLEQSRGAINDRLAGIRTQLQQLARNQAEHSEASDEFDATETRLSKRGKEIRREVAALMDSIGPEAEINARLDALQEPYNAEVQLHNERGAELASAAQALASEAERLKAATAQASTETERLQRDIAAFELVTEAFQVDLARHEARCTARFAMSGMSGWEEFDAETLTEAYARWQSGEFAQVLQIVEPLANQGDATAQFILGGLYSRGQGVPQDEELAARWWLKAAEQGMARAQNEIAVMLSDGRGIPEDMKQAVVWYRKAAEQGLGVAQANLGLMYWRGLGVTRNDSEAVTWLQKAAEQPDGFGWAEYYLGMAYSTGRGVRANQHEAFNWFNRAAERGYSDAQYALGAMYMNGAGVRRDQARAAHWWAQAAQDGHDAAERTLGAMLRQLPRHRIREATVVRAMPAAGAAVVEGARTGDFAYVLERRGGWIELYFQDSNTIGYVIDTGP